VVDAVLFDQVLANLLENAAKYTPSGTRVRVGAQVRRDDGVVRVTVEDAGPGVPDDALAHLFEKFYRVPGRSAGSRGGTGVGLAVVLGLTEAMGGRVQARRSEIGGLAVDIDLPIAASPTDDDTAGDTAYPSPARSTALGDAPDAEADQ
jgi:two-component system sensor histidine kinase KdpD